MFDKLKVGDNPTRIMAGLKMKMVVRTVTDKTLVCDAITEKGGVFRGGWTFDRETGMEIDDDLDWGPKYGRSGSYLEPTDD